MANETDDVVYTYEPREGAFISGLPQRDLTQADVDRVSPSTLRDALASGLYHDAKKSETKAAKTEKENDE